jgi:hypothetical protein
MHRRVDKIGRARSRVDTHVINIGIATRLGIGIVSNTDAGARDPFARHVTRGSSVHRQYAFHERGLCAPSVSATTQATL